MSTVSCEASTNSTALWLFGDHVICKGTLDQLRTCGQKWNLDFMNSSCMNFNSLYISDMAEKLTKALAKP